MLLQFLLLNNELQTQDAAIPRIIIGTVWAVFTNLFFCDFIIN